MEKKRKREKTGSNISNGVDIAHTLQEQNPDIKPSPEVPGGAPWQYPPVPPPPPQQQTGLQAPPAPPASEAALRAPAPAQPGAYWPPCPEFRPPSFESGWPPPPSNQSGAPGAFPFPPPGLWYGYPPPYFFGYPLPTNPSSHKGFIKPPQGLSQKHQKLWELQSAENIQLWTTLARVEAELASNRHRITQLEVELQALKPKTNPETTPPNNSNNNNNNEFPPAINSTTTAAALAPAPSTILPQPTPAPAKRGRYRKPVMGNIPPEAIAPRPRGRKPSSEKFRQATKQLLATSTGPLTGFAILPDPGAAAATNGMVSSEPGHQQQQQLVVEHQTFSFDPSANKIRRENGSGANFLNLEAIPIRESININNNDDNNNSKQVSPVNWAPVMQVAAAAARAATGPSDEDEEENEEDDVLAVGSSQVRW